MLEEAGIAAFVDRTADHQSIGRQNTVDDCATRCVQRTEARGLLKREGRWSKTDYEDRQPAHA